jgi:hypothetical protein
MQVRDMLWLKYVDNRSKELSDEVDLSFGFCSVTQVGSFGRVALPGRDTLYIY